MRTQLLFLRVRWKVYIELLPSNGHIRHNIYSNKTLHVSTFKVILCVVFIRLSLDSSTYKSL
jgi:hypothetical protein